MSRHAIEFDNCRVHDFLGNYTPEGLAKLQPEIVDIIGDALALQAPRKLLPGTVLEILRGCPTITARAADVATGARYARSTIAEYAMLAKIASQGIADHLAARGRRRAALLVTSPAGAVGL